MGRLLDRIDGACAAEVDWPHRVRAAVEAVLALFAADPELGRQLLFEPYRRGGEAQRRHEATLAGLAERLRAGRQASGRPLPALLEEILLGGLPFIIGQRLEAGRSERLVRLAPELTTLMLTPYLGREEAERIASRRGWLTRSRDGRTSAQGSPMDGLPSGPHALSPAYVEENQRARLFAALAETACEENRPASVATICKRAAVSTKDFYGLFRDREECFEAAFEAALFALRGTVLEACAGENDWTAGLGAALAALLERLSEDPVLARFLLIEAPPFDRAAPQRQQAAIEDFAKLLARGAPEPRNPRIATQLVAYWLVGGVVASLARHVEAGRTDLRPLFGELLAFLLGPYLGSSEARQIALRAATRAGPAAAA